MIIIDYVWKIWNSKKKKTRLNLTNKLLKKLKPTNNILM